MNRSFHIKVILYNYRIFHRIFLQLVGLILCSKPHAVFMLTWRLSVFLFWGAFFPKCILLTSIQTKLLFALDIFTALLQSVSNLQNFIGWLSIVLNTFRADQKQFTYVRHLHNISLLHYLMDPLWSRSIFSIFCFSWKYSISEHKWRACCAWEIKLFKVIYIWFHSLKY